MNSTRQSRGIVFGVWDLLHCGHLEYLDFADNLCDQLIIGIQSDESVKLQKGSYPAQDEFTRRQIISKLKYSPETFIYDTLDYKKHLIDNSATILFLSETHRQEDRFYDAIQAVGSMNVFYHPYKETVSTSKIKENIVKSWEHIWDDVALGDKDDYEIVGHNELKTRQLARYIENKLELGIFDTIVDYGCGTGVVLSELSGKKIGIDISTEILKRARLNDSTPLYIRSETLPEIKSPHKCFSWGVLHYLPSKNHAMKVLETMKNANIALVMELPDIDKRDARLAHRKHLGKILNPEPLYFSKQEIQALGYEVFDTELKISDNSDFSFTCIHRHMIYL